ncbi:MAG TPA: FtsX-like permease family protein [Bacteroidales bacterium]|nr:FtsX-like permease family protein [Bacteroidales bacterium]
MFVVIIFYRGFIDGWEQQSVTEAIEWEYGNGHLRNSDWDVSDPFTIQDGRGVLPENKRQNLSPVLLRQGSIYPEGRLMSVIIKGIKPGQQILDLPTQKLNENTSGIPAIIGVRMAESADLDKGDEVLLRWRDQNGTFDAANITVAGIFNTQIAEVDNGQIWIPIKRLWQMTGLDEHATYYIANSNYQETKAPGWNFVGQDKLLEDLRAMVQAERFAAYIIYGLLLAVALLAIFDTQVLSIFRRQKEIGTFISLGMTRKQVTRLFTVEGVMYSLLGTLSGVIWGMPIFIYIANAGIGIGDLGDGLGINMARTIYPEFGAFLIITTLFLVIGASSLVSFMPSRKIARMDPVQALKGRAK